MRAARIRASKFGNVKCIASDGAKIDSKRERKRYEDLLLLAKAGSISDLKRQVKYTLIPAQRARPTGPVLERAVVYIADFVYRDARGDEVIEDCKGYRTPEYVIKRKLMRWVHGIAVREV